MGFTEALGHNLRKPFEGRASRSEYWWFFLWTLIVAIVIGIVFFAMFGLASAGQGPEAIGAAFAGGLGIVGLVVLVPLYTLFFWMILAGTCTGARRLHDRNMSAWWLLLGVIPYVGGLILLVIFCLRGTSGPNRFGPDPLAVTDEAVFA